MRKGKSATREESILLVIVGLFMGTVFTFGMQHWNAPVAQEDARNISATFSTYEERRNDGRVQEIIVRFDDHEQLSIDGVCVDEDLREEVSSIEPGTVIHMLVHPNANTILQMNVGTIELLEFQDSVEKLSSEAGGFFVLGVLCYILSFIGMISLSKKK